jgi:tetratricopeptide (TPR) repeat protein
MMHRVLAAMLAIQVILYYLSPLHYWNHGTDLFLPKWLVMAQVPSLPQPNPMIDRTSFITVHASREHFEVGASSLFAGDFRAALDALKSSWELHPVELTSQLIVYCLESLQANESSGSRAISTDILWWRDAGKVIAATENPRERVYRISRLLRLQGDVRSAAGTLKSYIVEHPDDVAFSFELGCLLKDLGSTGEAAVMFERTLEMSPSFFKARLNLAAMYQSFNDLDRSITQYR